MKILNIKTNEIKEIKDKEKAKRMIRYPDLFQEVKETPKEEKIEITKKAEKNK